MKLFFNLTGSNEYDNMITGSNEPVKDILKEVGKLKIDKRKFEIAMARAELNRNTLAEKTGCNTGSGFVCIRCYDIWRRNYTGCNCADKREYLRATYCGI